MLKACNRNEICGPIALYPIEQRQYFYTVSSFYVHADTLLHSTLNKVPTPILPNVEETSSFQNSILKVLSSHHANATEQKQTANNQLPPLQSDHGPKPELQIWQPTDIQRRRHVPLLHPQRQPMPIKLLDLHLRHLQPRRYLPHHHQLSLLCPWLEHLVDSSVRRSDWGLLRQPSLATVTEHPGNHG